MSLNDIKYDGPRDTDGWPLFPNGERIPAVKKNPKRPCKVCCELKTRCGNHGGKLYTYTKKNAGEKEIKPRVPYKHWLRLQQFKTVRGVTMSSLVNDALDAYFASYNEELAGAEEEAMDVAEATPVEEVEEAA